MKSVSFRIRKIYYDQIVAGTKKVELRRDNDFWRKRIFVYNGGSRVVGIADIAVFVCGKQVHRRKIVGAGLGGPEDFLDRELSEQGKKDVGDKCIAVYLGNEYKEDK